MGKILILGGGFGGVRAALDLEKKIGKEAEITLVDRNSYQLFMPNLYEVAAAYNLPKDKFNVQLRRTVAIPYKEIFANKAINIIQSDIDHADLEKRIVVTKTGQELNYDYMVLALGSETADFGIPGVQDYAYQFKSVDDALRIREKILSLFEQAKNGLRNLPIKIIIGGAGFTGIETAAELAFFCRKVGKKYQLKGQVVHIYVLEAAPKILPQITDKERLAIRQRLVSLGVIIMENAGIEAVESDGVKIKTDGRMLHADLVIWTAGIKASGVLRNIKGLPLTEQGKIIVGEHLHLDSYKNVFAVGDNIQFMDHATQKPIPSLAYLAIAHGKIAAQNIYNSIREKELVVHKPFYQYWIAPIGGKFAYAHLGKVMDMHGFWGWLVRQFVDIRYLISILGVKSGLLLFWHELSVFSRND